MQEDKLPTRWGSLSRFRKVLFIVCAASFALGLLLFVGAIAEPDYYDYGNYGKKRNTSKGEMIGAGMGLVVASASTFAAGWYFSGTPRSRKP